MTEVATFRTLVLGSIFVALLGACVDFLPGMVPQPIVAAIDATIVDELSVPALLLGIAVLAVAIGGLVSTFGLLVLAPWSRTLALVVTMASLAVYPAMSPMVQSGWSTMLLTLSSLAWGAALAMAYVGSLSEAFRRDS